MERAPIKSPPLSLWGGRFGLFEASACPSEGDIFQIYHRHRREQAARRRQPRGRRRGGPASPAVTTTDYDMTTDQTGGRSPFARQSAWQRRNTVKVRAHSTVKRARKRGLIERQPCEVCGECNSEAHHPDYGQPLFVMWLCRRHHKAWHRENVACVPVIQDAPSIVPDADPGAFPNGPALDDEKE